MDRNSPAKSETNSRSYALIEADPDDFNHIIDLFRQFFPRTRIVECNHQPRHNSLETVSSYQSSSIDSESTTDVFVNNTQIHTFRGKVKDYLQRRYLEQNEQCRSEENVTNSDQFSPFNTSSLSLPNSTTESGTFNLPSRGTLHSRRLKNKRNEIQDFVDKSHSMSIIPGLMSPWKKEKSPVFTPVDYSSYSPFPIYEQYSLNSVNRLSLPLTPHSAFSDPGPHQSPWYMTPRSGSSSINFQFPRDHHLQDASPKLQEQSRSHMDDNSLNFSPEVKSHQIAASSPIMSHAAVHPENRPQTTTKNNREDLRQYPCRICSKRFARSDMLNRHLRLHTGLRPYRCTRCNAHFSRSDHLATHIRTHTGEKPYTCPKCSYTACRRDMITRHFKVHVKQKSERKNAISHFPSMDEFSSS